jgi:GNAT superfamily N-acetyltransferase
MPKYHLLYLNREEYLSSTSTIQDRRSLNFADMSLKWWDKKFGWYEKGCAVLSDESGAHLCYLFYKIDRYDNYLTIHNVFTPDINRRHGYAKELMLLVFNLAAEKKVKRFRLTCISNSLDFYLSLGFVYWGVNSVGDFYCDLPMPKTGLVGVSQMIQESSMQTLIGKSSDIISKKISDHSQHLTQAQTIKYNKDVIRLKRSYLQESFLNTLVAS